MGRMRKRIGQAPQNQSPATDSAHRLKIAAARFGYGLAPDAGNVSPYPILDNMTRTSIYLASCKIHRCAWSPGTDR